MCARLLKSFWDGEKICQSESAVSFSLRDAEEENGLLCVYPQERFQTIRGFGCALTESAGYVLEQMPEAARAEVIDACYGPDGLNYNLARLCIDSCDFSLNNYSAIEQPCTERLEGFSLERDGRYVIPLLRRVQSAAPGEVGVMMAPWSPPAFMKTNGERNHGGKLRAEYWGVWAKYICRYICEYRALGVDVRLLSPQNEPKAVQTWDSCIFTAEEEARFIHDYLYPELERAGLAGIVEIIGWDHNKERCYEWARKLFDGDTAAMVKGIGLHWYSGDHFDAVRFIRDRYPEKRLILTEACIEYRSYAYDDVLRNALKYGHEMIGGFNCGVDTFFDWNLTLDKDGGPNHAGNLCESPIMCDTEAGTYRKMPSYAYIGHMSRYFLPGARVLGVSSYTRDLEAAACARADGSIALTMLNLADEALAFKIRLNGKMAGVELPAKGIATCVVEVGEA